jgi:hypothetical protein
LTQHAGSPDQSLDGLVEPSAEEKKGIVSLISFDDIPSSEEMGQRAEKLAEIVFENGCNAAMIGGAPYFQAPLERALVVKAIKPLYAFSKRESEDQIQPDGSVRKVAVFCHAGWVAPYGLPEENI